MAFAILSLDEPTTGVRGDALDRGPRSSPRTETSGTAPPGGRWPHSGL